MRNQKYIFVLFAIILFSGCSSMKQSSEQRELAREVKQLEVLKVIESKDYVINLTRLFTKRQHRMDLRPSHNYIVVKGDKARINVAYVGRSFSTRPISGINVSGVIEEMDVTQKKKGSNLLKIRVREGGEVFDLYIHISSTGDCSIDINNARLDRVSYRGVFSSRL